MVLKDSVFGQIIRGRAQKKVHFFWLLATFVIIMLGTLSARFLYPNSYSILRRSISSLGNPYKNPDGYLYWNIAMFVTGFMLIPTLLYFYRALEPIAHITSQMFLYIGIISSLGISGVGLFSEETIIHYVFATIAFFGLIFAFSCNVYTLSKQLKSKAAWPKLIPTILLFAQLFLIMAGFLTAFSIYWLYYFFDIYLFIELFYLPLWEWLVLISNFVYISALFVMIPQELGSFHANR